MICNNSNENFSNITVNYNQLKYQYKKPPVKLSLLQTFKYIEGSKNKCKAALNIIKLNKQSEPNIEADV